MSKAYVATGEKAYILCSYDKNPAKALRKIAKLVEKMQEQDEWLVMHGTSVAVDEDGHYCLTTTVSTMA